MPTPRLPTQKARVSGDSIKNPQRYTRRADPATTPLGPAPDWMSEGAKGAWEGFRRELGWLSEADRALLEIVAPVRAAIVGGRGAGREPS